MSLTHDSQPLPLGIADIGSILGGFQRNTLPFRKMQGEGTTSPSASLISFAVTLAIRIGRVSSSRMLDKGLSKSRSSLR